MPALIALALLVSTVALVYSLSTRKAAATISLDRRRSRVGGFEPAEAAPPSNTLALRGSRLSRSGGMARALSGVSWSGKLAAKLERAGWRLSVAEFLSVCATCMLIVGFLTWTRTPLATPVAGLAGAFLPYFLLSRAEKKRRNKFVGQLVEVLTLMANALKAGISLMQAMDKAAEQSKDPVAEELRHVLHDVQIGATPDDAFNGLNSRIRSDDLDIVVTAIIVQRSTGGNLAEILEGVAHTMRERLRIRGEIKTLISQQQMSGYLIAMIPLFLLIVFNFTSHDYVAPMFGTTVGHVMLGFGGVLQLVGLLIIRKIVNIEV